MSLTGFVVVVAVLAGFCLVVLVAAAWTARSLRCPTAGWRMLNEREEFAPVLDWLEWWRRGSPSA